MGTRILIEPVTRIEGHAKVAVHVDDAGRVERAVLHVNEFRGFEKFCEGRLFFEMPVITERICGICPVSHHLASVKACDRILGVEPPRPARLLRELMHMGQVIQSHSMHFFELAGPDLLLGFDAAPAERNVVGLAAADPSLAVKAIRLRKFGQEIIAALGERRVHPNFAVPGGVACALPVKARDAILQQLPDMIGIAREGLGIVKAWTEKNRAEVESFGAFESMYLGMVDAEGALQLYDGPLKLVDAARASVAAFDGSGYLRHIAEHVEDWSYLKSPYYRPMGYPDGVYRVGPLARLNVAGRVPTELAQQEYEAYHAFWGGRVPSATLAYHWARLVENLYALERVRQILEDPDALSTDLRAPGKVTSHEGVGVLEAPRGTLVHHYVVDDDGTVRRVNLIVATGHNNHAMSRAVDEVARKYVDPGHLTEGSLNRIEAAIRAYDPCLSCSTHAAGSMPIEVTVYGPGGAVVGRLRRGDDAVGDDAVGGAGRHRTA